MASSSSLLLFFSLSLTLFAIGANARPGPAHFHPCKTLYISSFTISPFKQNPIIFSSSEDQFQIKNPNPNQIQNPTRLFTIFTDFYPKKKQELEIFIDFDRRRPTFDSEFRFPHSMVIDKPEIRHHHHHQHHNSIDSFGVSSLRERSKDILSVVAALLFGVGCGALTSATMYLAWSLITNRYEGHGDDYVDFSDDDVSPKKMGYSKIADDVPAAAPVSAPAKEVV